MHACAHTHQGSSIYLLLALGLQWFHGDVPLPESEPDYPEAIVELPLQVDSLGLVSKIDWIPDRSFLTSLLFVLIVASLSLLGLVRTVVRPSSAQLEGGSSQTP